MAAPETRTDLTAGATTLCAADQPKVSKSSLKTYILRLIKSLMNLRNDTWQAPVKSALFSPPGSPADGDRHVIKSPAAGAWADHEQEIATWDAAATAWAYSVVPDGTYAISTDYPLLAYIKTQGVFRTVRNPVRSFINPSGQTQTSSTTIDLVSMLSGEVKEGQRYRIDIRMIMESASISNGVKISVTGPTCDKIAWTARIPVSNIQEAVYHAWAWGSTAVTTSVPAADQPFQVDISITINNPTSTDYVYAMMASSGGAQVRLLQGSTMDIQNITA